MQPTLSRWLDGLRRQAALPGEDSDAALLSRFARQREEDAFAALVARHGRMVTNVCHRILGDWHAAEDAAQGTFLVLARKAGHLRRPALLASWLYGVARRVALKARGAALPLRQISRSADAEDRADPRADPLAVLTGRDLLRVLEEEMRGLPRAYRLPVVLCCLEGFSIEEAARRLGCTTGSVKGRLERGRARLHKQLARRGLTLAAALATAEMSRAVTSAALSEALAKLPARAVAFAAGSRAAASVVSLTAIELAHRELRAMSLSKLKVVCVLLAVTVLSGAGLGRYRVAPEASVAAAAHEDKARPVEWEYKALPRSNWASMPLGSVEGLAPKGSVDRLTDGLNKLGEQGWELVAIEPDRQLSARALPPGPATYIFKRRK
jgi:RNA polymerase sigma factor (sigma-70 family)